MFMIVLLKTKVILERIVILIKYCFGNSSMVFNINYDIMIIRKGVDCMEYRKTIVDGTEYNLLTDEELEDLKVLMRNEQKLKDIENGNTAVLSAVEFRKTLREEYGL